MQTNNMLRDALKEIEAHITATLAHQPDDDAECGQFLYNALVKVFNIADMAIAWAAATDGRRNERHAV